MSKYAASELRRLSEAGPHDGDNFFRLKVTGNGETRWVNITPAELIAIIRIVDVYPDRSTS